jgi:hypothetical protein
MHILLCYLARDPYATSDNFMRQAKISDTTSEKFLMRQVKMRGTTKWDFQMATRVKFKVRQVR